MDAVSARCVRDLAPDELTARLTGDGLGLQLGPFDLNLRLDVRHVVDHWRALYADFPVLEGERVFSCHIGLAETRRPLPRALRRVRFTVDGRPPHEDMPSVHALAVLEWGINLVVALRFHRFLMLHAAVVERAGRALLMPAAPGDGKTTLCAALAHRGWRLLSDEFGLVRPETGLLVPMPRPMPLKNESIAVLRAFAPEAVLGPEIANTRKGTVAHVRPPVDSVRRAAVEVPAGWLVFPRWVAGAPLTIEPVPRTEAFMRLATNAFNYDTVGEAGFAAVRSLVDRSRCFQLVYSDLDAAIAALSDMADSDGQ